jgi:hypothetical protein
MRTESGSALLRIDRIPVDGGTRDALDGLDLPPEVIDQWSRYREPLRRFILVARTDAGISGAAIVASRPQASYLKIGGVWAGDSAGDSDQVELALISEAEQLAWELGCLVVKLEILPGTRLPAASPSSGYVDVAAPEIAAPIPDPSPPVPSALFKWRAPSTRTAVPYMRQTTEFTCGTASLSMVLTHFGLIGGPDRATELDLWRQATTVLACDPYGLAVVATRQGLRPTAGTVSTQNALFTEQLPTEQDRELRSFIQGGFRRQAEQAGVDTQLRAFDVGELRDIIASGGLAMVLVDELLVHGQACPHWILIHGLEGEHLIAHDPWSEVSQGESWLDAYDVPLPAEALDQIAWTGEPPYRAMISFSR